MARQVGCLASDTLSIFLCDVVIEIWIFCHQRCQIEQIQVLGHPWELLFFYTCCCPPSPISLLLAQFDTDHYETWSMDSCEYYVCIPCVKWTSVRFDLLGYCRPISAPFSPSTSFSASSLPSSAMSTSPFCRWGLSLLSGCPTWSAASAMGTGIRCHGLGQGLGRASCSTGGVGEAGVSAAAFSWVSIVEKLSILKTKLNRWAKT